MTHTATTQPELTPAMLLQLETMIDRTSLSAVLDALQVVCDEKAEHLITNWQDPTSARHWTNIAHRLHTLSRASIV